MSYLTVDSSTLEDFTEVVISLWFRVPQASIDAADAAWSDEDPAPPFNGFIPLVVMGKKGKGQTPYATTREEVVSVVTLGYTAAGLGNTQTTDVPPPTNFAHDGDTRCLAHGSASAFCTVVTNYNLGASWVLAPPDYGYATQYTTAPRGAAPPTEPTFIGLDCSGATGGPAILRVSFETARKPDVSGYAFDTSIALGPAEPTIPSGSVDFSQGTITETGCSIGFGLPLPFYDTVTTGSAPISHQPAGTEQPPVYSYPDISTMVVNSTGAIYSDQIPVTADEWHHVLVSLKLNTIAVHGVEGFSGYSGNFADYVDSAAQLYVALDDVNYTGWDLSSDYTEGDPNDVITDGAWSVGGRYPQDDQHGVPLGTPEYSLSDPTIPCKENPMGLPASAEFVDNVYHVEMAEFQLFAGLQIDTGDTGSRRYFVDSDGKPVPAAQKQSATKTSGSIEGLGQKPDIMIHGSSDWTKGKNTGSLGVDDKGKLIQDGQFTPVAKIDPYKPDPSLHGPQGRAGGGGGQVRLSRRPAKVRV